MTTNEAFEAIVTTLAEAIESGRLRGTVEGNALDAARRFAHYRGDSGMDAVYALIRSSNAPAPVDLPQTLNNARS